jgi:hypothetical protein
MGSFANSLHVHSNDAVAVAEAIRATLLAQGYEGTDETPGEEAMWGLPSDLRAIHVSAAKDGWVSVLDSDLMNSLGLLGELSRRLGTHALHVFVNDSDSWQYQLYHAGRQVDTFDSEGEDDFDEDSEDEEDEAEDSSGGVVGSALSALQQNLPEAYAQFQAKWDEMLTPEMRAIQERWKSGRATPEEIQEYTRWAQTEMPRMMGGLQSVLGELSSALAARRRQPKPGNPGNSQPHIDRLRPLLKQGVTDEQLHRVFGAKQVFAEHTLGEFLPLLGIASFYANLSYRYLEEYTEKDLARKSIQMAEHLKFKKSSEHSGSGLRIVR